jgi:pyruvate dehydrogenase E2 component (dihydrolipoamide acetyltransferase)
MAKEVIMPALGMAQDEGVLLRWFKKEGEMVTAGEPLMEVATDKVDVQVDAPASGLLTAVTAKEGDEIPVGQVIAQIAAEGEELPAPQQASDPVEASAGDRPVDPPLPSSPVAARIAAEHGINLAEVSAAGGRISKEDVEAHIRAADSGARVLASPKARRLARERGIDLATLVGNGPEGAVLAADVPQTAQPQIESLPQPVPEVAATTDRAPAAMEPETQAVSRMWQIMAQRLTESWNSVPHFYLVREVNVAQLINWRTLLSTDPASGAKITYTDMLTKLAALSLARFPRLNSFWDDGKIVTNPDINVGLAIAVEEGLLVPVVHSADRLRVDEIAARRADLVARANSAGLLPDDFAGGTFTISNLGMYGVDAFNAIVNPPQAAILAVGRIADRVVAENGQPAVRPMMTLTLSCDHRAVDGVRAAQFLDALVGMIEEPLRAL